MRIKLLSERLLAWRDTQGRYALDRRILRAPRRIALVRTQRGERAALLLSRLEIRPYRPVHRGAVRAGGKRLLRQDQAEVLSADRARRHPVGLYGAVRSCSRRSRRSNGRRCRRRIAITASAGRSATTCRRWRAASIPATSRSCTAPTCTATRCTGAPRARTTSATEADLRDRGIIGRPVSSARGATPRPGSTTGASRQWIMPWYTMVPPYGDNALNAHAWVPIDDENCFTWTFTYHPTRPLSAMELDTMRKGRRHPCRADSRHASGR